MTKWLQWIVLSAVTGSPVLSAVILLAFWWTADRFTFRLLPDPSRWVRRALRVSRLRRDLAGNPHDRRARRELGELLIEQRRYPAAVEVLRPNLVAGDEDASTLFAMGVACLGAGHYDQGLLFLEHLEEGQSGFRSGEVDLVRGRWLLKKGDHAGAKSALERLIQARHGTIEGRVLLSRALAAQGDEAGAAKARADAWKEYVTAPRFQRRAERWWAWSAKPSRPLTYAALALAAALLFAVYVAPALQQTLASAGPGGVPSLLGSEPDLGE